MDNFVMYKLSYGLFVLTAKDGEKDNGCIINTAIQVTISPNRIVMAVNKENYTHDMIVKTGEFNLSVLDESSKFDMYKHFGYQSGKDTDKSKGIAYKRSANGLMYVTEGVNAYLSCKVVSQTDLGSHTLFLADVTDGEILDKTESVTYAYYQKNIKPIPQVKEEQKKGYICEVCGYIYEGDELSADYICPICKHPASDFRKL